jgi:TusE/DsrC/DsvC family sulfur relay protein
LVNGKNVFDEKGFLKSPDLWNLALARKMAEDQFNIEMTELHIQAVSYLREYYQEWGTLPMVRTIRNYLKISSEQFDELFRRKESSARGVLCKISGLPMGLCTAAGC